MKFYLRSLMSGNVLKQVHAKSYKDAENDVISKGSDLDDYMIEAAEDADAHSMKCRRITNF